MTVGSGMTAAEFRCLRESLGLTRVQAADLLRVAERTVRRWELGEVAVPDGVAAELWRIVTHTGNVRDEAVNDANESLTDPVVVVFRSDEDLWYARPSMRGWPASWHRVIAARVAVETGARIVFADEIGP